MAPRKPADNDSEPVILDIEDDIFGDEEDEFDVDLPPEPSSAVVDGLLSGVDDATGGSPTGDDDEFDVDMGDLPAPAADDEPVELMVVDASTDAVHDIHIDDPVPVSFMWLPLTGDDAPIVSAQARDSSSLNDESLSDLISSIGTHGVLQPVRVETLADGTRRLVLGERRLRACRWLAENMPDNPHIALGIPAIVAEAPLPEETLRAWQWSENFARVDFTVHEMGAALLWMRCAMMTERVTAAGHPPPADALAEPDPVKRWARLEEHRIAAGAHRIGAPWPEVVHRLGVQMSPARAAQLVKAFSTLPEGVGPEMDAQAVSLHSRLQWLKLRGRDEVRADEVWATVKETDAGLLPAAVDIAMDDPDSPVEEVVDAAVARRDDANEARAVAAAANNDTSAASDWIETGEVVDNAVATGGVVISQKMSKYAKVAADKLARLVKELEDDDVVIDVSQAERLRASCVTLLDVIEDQLRPKRRTNAF